jgi:hypothetical protein
MPSTSQRQLWQSLQCIPEPTVMELTVCPRAYCGGVYSVPQSLLWWSLQNVPDPNVMELTGSKLYLCKVWRWDGSEIPTQRKGIYDRVICVLICQSCACPHWRLRWAKPDVMTLWMTSVTVTVTTQAGMEGEGIAWPSERYSWCLAKSSTRQNLFFSPYTDSESWEI